MPAFERLGLAINTHDLPTVESLLKSGTDPNEKDSSGTYPVERACLSCHVDMMQLLAKYGAKFDFDLDVYRQNALHKCAAAQADEVNIAAALAFLVNEHKCDVNKGNSFGETPAHKAARGGKVIVVQALASLGADLLKEDQDGKTCADLAKKGGHVDVVGVIEKWKANPASFTHSGLIQAIQTKDVSLVRELLSQRTKDGHSFAVTANCTDLRDVPAIVLVASSSVDDNNALFRLFVELRSEDTNFSAKDKNGRSAILWACHNLNLEIVQMLLDNNLCSHDFSKHVDNAGDGVVHFALYGHEANHRKYAGQTAELKKHEQKVVALLQYLAAQGADPNATNNDRRGGGRPIDQAGAKHKDSVQTFLTRWATNPSDFVEVAWLKKLATKHKLKIPSGVCSAIRTSEIDEGLFLAMSEAHFLAMHDCSIRIRMWLFDLLKKEAGSATLTSQEKLQSENIVLKNQLELQAAELLQKESEILRLKQLLEKK